MFTNVDWIEIYQASLDTLLMLGLSTLFSVIIGLPIGILLYLTGKSSLMPNFWVNSTLALVVNILRSVPFIILIILMMPATVWLMGTSIGVRGVVPALTVGAFPFIARLIESALKEIDSGIIKMAKSFGANNWQIVKLVLIPEIIPSMVGAIVVTTIALVSYTAMAGVVGGGGLGDLAIRYGYNRFQPNVMIITVILLVLLVQLIQYIGDKIVNLFRVKT